MPSDRLKKLLPKICPWLVFLIPFLVYLRTMAPTITFGDSGELIAAAYGLGIPHPPGFPLWVILTRLFMFIPVGDIAYRANLSSAFFICFGLVVVYFFIKNILTIIATNPQSNKSDRSDRSNRTYVDTNLLVCFVSTFSAIYLGFSYTNWSQSVFAEVYTLSFLFSVLCPYILFQWYVRKNLSKYEAAKFSISENHLIRKLARRLLYLVSGSGKQTKILRKKISAIISDPDFCLYLFSFLFGLSLTTHYLTIDLAPAFAIFIVIIEPKILFNLRKLGLMFGLFALAFGVYLFLPLRSCMKPIIDWGETCNWNNFLSHLRRLQYSGYDTSVGLYLPFSKTVGEYTMIKRFTLPFQVIARILFREFWILSVLSIPGMIFLWLREKRIFGLLFLSILFAGYVFYVLTGDLMMLRQKVYPEHMGPSAFFLIFIAVALFYLINFLRKIKFQDISLILPTLIFTSLSPLYLIFSNFHHIDQSKNNIARLHAENMLKTAKPNAIIIGEHDEWVFPILYLLAVEKVRPDVQIIDRHGVMAPHNYKIPKNLYAKGGKPLGDYMQKLDKELIANAGDRPVYYTEANTCQTLTPYPKKGILVTVKNDNDPLPEDYYQFYKNIMSLKKEDLSEEFYSRQMVSWYHATYAYNLFKAGYKDQAFQELERVKNLDPDEYWTLDKVGLCYQVMGKPDLAEPLYFKMQELRPDRATSHINVGRIYEAKGDLKNAEENYKKAVIINDQNRDIARKTLVSVYLKQSKWQETIDFVEGFFDEENPEANETIMYFALGVSYGSTGKPNQAIEFLEKAKALGLKTADVYTNLGILYYNTGNKEKSKENMETALEIDKDNVTAKKFLNEKLK